MSSLIALDPGIGRTGYAVLSSINGKVIPLEYGCLVTKVNGALETRLLKLYQELKQVVEKHQPQIMVLERLFFGKNQTTAITVGQAQGVMLLVAAEQKLKIDFVTPPQIKAALTGYGAASKAQVMKMVMLLLELNEVPTPDDTADALACGLTYLATHKFNQIQ